MGNGKGGDDRDKRQQFAKRIREAKQEQQMVDAACDMKEPGLHEAEGRLCQRGSSRTRPGSPCTSNTRIVPSLRRHDTQCGVDAQTKALQARPD